MLEVNRSVLYELRIVPSPERELAQGEIRVSVSSFGLTANNVTYAVFGEMMAYWRFFPAPGGPEWGVVPVWGFGEVVESTVGGIDVGERIYGYLPMATELVMAPERVGSGSFVDAAAHRRELPAVYNRYARCGGDPGYTVELEDAQMLLQPLFTTSFLIDDFLADSEFFGAGRIVLTSASSKTAFGTAHLLHRRGGLEIVGLTSASNAPFVEDLGCYDRVLTYDQIERLGDEDGDAVLLDFAGDQQTVQLIHHRLGDRAASLCGDRRHALGRRTIGRGTAAGATTGVLLRPRTGAAADRRMGCRTASGNGSVHGGASSSPSPSIISTSATIKAWKRRVRCIRPSWAAPPPAGSPTWSDSTDPGGGPAQLSAPPGATAALCAAASMANPSSIETCGVHPSTSRVRR